MRLQIIKSLLLSSIPVFGTIFLNLGYSTNSVMASEPKCPNIQGGYHRDLDNFTMYFSQNGCTISSDAPSTAYDHKLKGKWTGRKFDYTIQRRNIKTGCTTRMYGKLYKIDDSQLKTDVYGSDGRCDLPTNYTENSVWDLR